jgi:hypothetical protein
VNYSQTARDFQVYGVRLGMTTSEFQKQFPTVKRDTSQKQEPGVARVQVDRTEDRSEIRAMFWEGKLVQYHVNYSDRIYQMGGWEVLLKRFVEQLGKAEIADDSNQVQLYWNFDETGFRLDFYHVPSKRRYIGSTFRETVPETFIRVRDTIAYGKYSNERLDRNNPGF